MEKDVQTYQIWAEGYSATGQSGTATYMGSASGETFKDAVKELAKRASPEDRAFYNTDRIQPTYWGCRLFDNEEDARKSFG